MPMAEADIRASLDAVIDDVDSNERIYGHLGEVARATRDLVDTVEHRFEQVEHRFEQVDQRFEQVDQRFDRVETQLGLIGDEVRVTGARVEKLVRYIVRDELKVGDPDGT